MRLLPVFHCFALFTVCALAADKCAIDTADQDSVKEEDFPKDCTLRAGTDISNPCNLARKLVERCKSDKQNNFLQTDCDTKWQYTTGIMINSTTKMRVKRDDVFSGTYWFYYNASTPCVKMLIEPNWLIGSVSVSKDKPIYAYTLLQKKVNTWQEARRACIQIKGNLPVFHDENQPGMILYQFNLLQRAMEVYSMWSKKPMKGDVYKYKMGSLWKGCIPIGLVKNVKSFSDVTDPTAWNWINGRRLEKPTADWLEDRYWLPNQPSDELHDKLGPMKYGYMTIDQPFEPFINSTVPKAGYFNDVNNFNAYSKKQKSAVIESRTTGSGFKMRDLKCDQSDKTCMPCKPSPTYVICQRKMKKETGNPLEEDVSVIPANDEIPGLDQGTGSPNYFDVPPPTPDPSAAGITPATILLIVVCLVFVVLVGIGLYCDTLEGKRAKRVRHTSKDSKKEGKQEETARALEPETAAAEKDPVSVSAERV